MDAIADMDVAVDSLELRLMQVQDNVAGVTLLDDMQLSPSKPLSKFFSTQAPYIGVKTNQSQWRSFADTGSNSTNILSTCLTNFYHQIDQIVATLTHPMSANL